MDIQNLLIALVGVIVLYIIVKMVKRNQSSAPASTDEATASNTAETANAVAEPTTTANPAQEEEVMAVIAATVAMQEEEVIAVIAAAVAAMGYDSDQIASIRPAKLKNWTLEARLSGRRQG
ncbi:MAG: hypothetical protein SOY76_02660 [Veillonella caviae]|nr:hypothetical protein [Veillonella caviae]